MNKIDKTIEQLTKYCIQYKGVQNAGKMLDAPVGQGSKDKIIELAKQLIEQVEEEALEWLESMAKTYHEKKDTNEREG